MIFSDQNSKQKVGLLSNEYIPTRKVSFLQSAQKFWWLTAYSLLLVTFTLVNVGLWSQTRVAIWDTDIADAHKAIEYEKRTFTGALTLDQAQGTVVRLKNAETEYFGPPSPAIDHAWEKLMENEFPTMTKEEAAPFGDELRPLWNIDGEYHFEPDVFHSLHCLNAIRKELTTVLYNITRPMPHWHSEYPHYRETHIEHCLDHIMQGIMCHGDMTPSPIYSFPGDPLALGRSGVHTCRKFENLRRWMDHRAENGKSLTQ